MHRGCSGSIWYDTRRGNLERIYVMFGSQHVYESILLAIDSREKYAPHIRSQRHVALRFHGRAQLPRTGLAPPRVHFLLDLRGSRREPVRQVLLVLRQQDSGFIAEWLLKDVSSRDTSGGVGEGIGCRRDREHRCKIQTCFCASGKTLHCSAHWRECSVKFSRVVGSEFVRENWTRKSAYEVGGRLGGLSSG